MKWRPPAERFADLHTKPSDGECWVWIGSKTSQGYGEFWSGERKVKAHRFAWEMARGPIPTGQHVCHSCDNPSCVNVAHMWLGTNADNVADKVRKGRAKALALRHEANPAAKLTWPVVWRIRAMASMGAQQRWIAKRFGMGQAQVSRIVRGESWIERCV